jgi:pimeloyl-ACP methyl ester carboxylesterase
MVLGNRVALLSLLSVYWVGEIRAQGTDGFRDIHLQPCEVQVQGGGKCGIYDVFENRTTKTGRKLSLNILVIPAISATPAPDPVFWLEGGPGGGATQAAGPVSQNYLRGLRNDHDLVFVDQRGTGKSSPLKCDDIGETPANLAHYFGKLFPLDLIRACREKLDKVADLKLYTTPIAMDDLEEVRNALGYKQINLAAASYGTLAAQVYIRKYPGRVRSAFLVGVVTPGFKLPLPFASAAQNALDLLFQDCAVASDCHTAFPNLKDEFYAVLARFDRGPLEVTIVDPATKRERPITLERENYVEHIRALLYSTTSARFVPLVVHQAFLNDFVPFGVMAIRVNLGGPSTSRGLYFSTTCAESIPFITGKEIVDSTRGTFLGDRRVRAHIAACGEWPRGAVSKNFTDPVKAQTPVLMFSGEADGSTPPWIAADAVKLWPRGGQIIARHTGHQIDGPCTWDLMSSFFRSGSVGQIDSSCIETAHRPPFATELTQ